MKSSKIKALFIGVTHSMLMLANIFYLVYETEITGISPIPMMFSMYFLLNFSNVVGFRMITLDFLTDSCKLGLSALGLLFSGIIFIGYQIAVWFIGVYGV
jgi:hypothetical protein